MRLTVRRQKLAFCTCEPLNTYSTIHGEVLYLKKFLLFIACMFVSTAAHAATVPAWIDTLTRHEAIQEVNPEQRQEVTCLALAIYFEARGESIRGQQAVGNVVMNRVQSPRYPKTVCGVLFQRGQFSFIRGGKAAIPKTPRLWDNAIRMASQIISGKMNDVSFGALSFCQKHLRKNGRVVIGGHVFY